MERLDMKRTKVPQFWTVTVFLLMTLAASAVLASVFWHLSGIRPWAIGLILAGAFLQLFRIHQVYKDSYQKAVEGDEPAQRILLELVRVYRWGNGAFFVLALVVVQVYLSTR